MLEHSFLEHIGELRSRILRSVIFIIFSFVLLVFFSNQIYLFVASPLQEFLPIGSSMIATEVASPLTSPLKVTFYVSLLISLPYALSQLWGFIDPGLYKEEKRLSFTLLIVSTLLLYAGIAFTYFLVFPLIFNFFTSVVPQGIVIMTDISKYLDFVLSMMFAFSIAFEIPVLVFLLIKSGITSPEKLAKKRPYVVVLFFILAMLLTPPDVISQTLLALPAWMLFELGIFLGRTLIREKKVINQTKK